MFIDATNDAKTNLSELLIQIRSGESKSSELQQQFKTIRSNVISPNEILIEKVSKIIQHHIDFINFLKTKNITILNKKSKFHKLLLNNPDKDIYILFFAEEYAKDNRKILNQFIKMVNDRQVYNESVFVAVKIDIINEIEPGHHNGTVSTIDVYQDGELTIEGFGQGEHNLTEYKEIWSPKRMQDTLEFLLTRVNGNIDIAVIILIHINSLLKVPIGFIYLQLPGKEQRDKLWPSTEWEDISERYAGLFFRVLGNGSEPFESVQNENYKKFLSFYFTSLIGLNYSDTIIKPNGIFVYDQNKLNQDIIVPPVLSIEEFESRNRGLGFADNDKVGINYLHFRLSDDEIRPKNTAIKIWDRIG